MIPSCVLLATYYVPPPAALSPSLYTNNQTFYSPTVSQSGVSITDQNISHTALNSGTATAGYRIDSDGGAYSIVGAVGGLLETWLLGGLNSDYEVRATLVSGDTPTGTLNTWQVCSTDRSWSVTATGGGGIQSSCVLTIELRDAASPNTVRDSASITLTARSESTL